MARKRLLSVGEQLQIAIKRSGKWSTPVRIWCEAQDLTLREFAERNGVTEKELLGLVQTRLPNVDHLDADIYATARDCGFPESTLHAILIKTGLLVAMIEKSLLARNSLL